MKKLVLIIAMTIGVALMSHTSYAEKKTADDSQKAELGQQLLPAPKIKILSLWSNASLDRNIFRIIEVDGKKYLQCLGGGIAHLEEKK